MRRIDPTSTIWRAILRWGAAEIDKAREDLETPGLSVEKTEFLRGRLAALRELSALPQGDAVALAREREMLQRISD